MTPSADNLAPTPGRSWRSIRQEVKPLAMSRKGRRRRLLAGVKLFTLCASCLGLGWGVYEIVHTWSTDRAALATAVHSERVRDVVLITDGVLTRDWANATLALPKDSSLMALDLSKLRDKLLASGQVRVAVLTRNFPDTLVVTLQERNPVARVQAADESGVTKQLLVAKDGEVYDGLYYDKAMLAGLPWLDGIRLVKTGDRFEPIEGLPDVSALLSTAQLQAPHLYRDWLVVSLAHLAERDEIVVKGTDVPEVVFSRKRDFFKQVAQLDDVIERVTAVGAGLESAPRIQSVNLVFEGQAPVRLQAALPAPAAAGSDSSRTLQPLPRKLKLEL